MKDGRGNREDRDGRENGREMNDGRADWRDKVIEDGRDKGK